MFSPFYGLLILCLFLGGQAGPHGVGFTVKQLHDPDRTINIAGEETKRPIQILLWYPALKDGEKSPMSYKEFVFTSATFFDFRPLTEEKKKEAVDYYTAFPLECGADDKKLQELLNKKTPAVRDAPPASGAFPFIIYAPSLNSDPYENTELIHLLVSNGYVVAASASPGPNSLAMPIDSSGAEAQMKDLEFILDTMKNHASVDKDRIGTLGYSWGGLANVLMALKRSEIKAAVSMDGAICLIPFMKAAERFPFYKTGMLEIPFMYFSQPTGRYDFTFLEKNKGKDLSIFRFKQISHRDFASDFILKLVHAAGKNSAKVDASYEMACVYVLNFFNAYLKGNEEALDFLRHAPDNPDLLEIIK